MDHEQNIVSNATKAATDSGYKTLEELQIALLNSKVPDCKKDEYGRKCCTLSGMQFRTTGHYRMLYLQVLVDDEWINVHSLCDY